MNPVDIATNAAFIWLTYLALVVVACVLLTVRDAIQWANAHRCRRRDEAIRAANRDRMDDIQRQRRELRRRLAR